MLKHDCGVLSAATAFGKTVIAARLIAERKTNTLILTHRQQLLSQWMAKLAEFLEIDEELPVVGEKARAKTAAEPHRADRCGKRESGRHYRCGDHAVLDEWRRGEGLHKGLWHGDR